MFLLHKRKNKNVSDCSGGAFGLEFDRNRNNFVFCRKTSDFLGKTMLDKDVGIL